MEHLIFLAIAGICGGLLGGMGMGGGTLLIPLLTLALGVEQRTAQFLNLAAFIPMSVFVLYSLRSSGLLEIKRAVPMTLTAVLASVGASFLAASLPADLLRRLFGGFLIIVCIFSIRVFTK